MIGNRNFAAIAALTLALVTGTPAYSAECDGVQFEDSVTVGGKTLVLNGLGMRLATMFNVKVYVAGLYLPQKSTDGLQIAATNEPWQMHLKFVHDASASDIREALDEGFEKSAGGNLTALKDRIDTLKSEIVDIKAGDYLSYTYDPASGTVADINGTSGTPMQGADFAEALLLMSIGPEPPNQELKTGLLGGACQ